ncbi:hypothetical protein H2200_002294 [Cladophialophora chaetospira]|uniref:Uncharacterized protein n=1 Tax=Cladophialophora chaetospira TaxID=386627 RepID=A0AA38XIT9_9EURO|nr:hypothetical protein H2200_002294 [Cladophialophora chaetospira]
MSVVKHTISTILSYLPTVRYTAGTFVIYLPTIAFFWFAKANLGTLPALQFLLIFLLTGHLGGPIALHAQRKSRFLLSSLVFGDETTGTRYLAKIHGQKEINNANKTKGNEDWALDPVYWLFHLAYFTLASLAEECMKYIFVAPCLSSIYQAQIAGQHLQWDNANLWAAAAAGLGFSTWENMHYLRFQLRKPDGGDVLHNAIQRTLLCNSGHIMMVMLSALNFLSLDVRDNPLHIIGSMWQVLSTATLMHGCFNFFCHAMKAMGFLGWFSLKSRFSAFIGFGIQISFLASLSMLILNR